ncbi:MAG: pirin family protein [Gloeocapsa sp. UFS-A4-WI-NPMV-4B04]|jgi:hypothetical protein|nr:pirin family protein [Gloeocapsa sp. UFS-A4-WI-NPMV-4B04]
MPQSILDVLEPEVKDLGGFEIRRVLPHATRQMIGPFIFFDHVGPATFAPGQGMDVRSHPHINLATVTYLFEGALLHRDSLNVVQEIQPGAVNWMTAGRGIVHSERSPNASRSHETNLHGIQTWVALPDEHEETNPWFRHYPATDIPTWQDQGVSITLIAGQAYGRTSPVQTFSPMIYLDVQLPAGTQFTLPPDYSEQAVYSVTNGLSVDGEPLEPQRMIILPQQSVSIGATADTRCIVVGGEPVGKRYKWWNFVSSRLERIEQAKADWQNGQFDQVPQETEFIPLPEEPHQPLPEQPL